MPLMLRCSQYPVSAAAQTAVACRSLSRAWFVFVEFSSVSVCCRGWIFKQREQDARSSSRQNLQNRNEKNVHPQEGKILSFPQNLMPQDTAIQQKRRHACVRACHLPLFIIESTRGVSQLYVVVQQQQPHQLLSTNGQI